MNSSPQTNYLNAQQGNEEHIVLVCRRHWITFLPSLFFGVVLSITPIIMWSIFSSTLDATFFQNDANSIIATLFLLMYLLTLALFLLINWIDSYFDVTFITNKRIVDIDQVGIVKRSTTAMNIIDVQEVRAQIGNLAENIFNYGNIFIQSAGSKQNIEMNLVPEPKKVAKIINDLHAYLEYERKARQQSAFMYNIAQPATPQGVPYFYSAHPQRIQP